MTLQAPSSFEPHQHQATPVQVLPTSSIQQPPPQPAPPTTHLLHRSPSGAQKKIRQRRDEKNQQLQLHQNRLFASSSPITNKTSSSTSSSTSIPSLLRGSEGESPSHNTNLDYRSLVDLDSYRSILPPHDTFNQRFAVDSPTPSSQSVRMESDKPSRPPRTSDFSRTKFASYDGGTDGDTHSNGLDNGSSTNNNNSSTNGYYFGKPTVQVHPMPAMKLGSLSSSSSSISPPDTLKKQPPPVPKKPSQISKRAFTINDSFSEVDKDVQPGSEEISSSALFWTSKAAKSPLSTPIIGTKPGLTASPDPKPSLFTSHHHHQKQHSNSSSIINSFSSSSDANTRSSSSIAQSTESLPLLCNSPSLLSLQNSLNHALNNPEQHTREQLQELEKRRLQSMDSLSKKAYERRLDREAVCEELEQVDQIRVAIFKSLSTGNSYGSSDPILSRLNVHIIQGERLVELETRLQMQLEKLENAQINQENEDDGIAQRKRRLAQQLEDALVIRASYNQRDEELDNELSQLVSRNLFLEWRFYKQTVLKLNVEKKQIDEKLKSVKGQLEALQTMASIVQNSNNTNQQQASINVES